MNNFNDIILSLSCFYYCCYSVYKYTTRRDIVHKNKNETNDLTEKKLEKEIPRI